MQGNVDRVILLSSIKEIRKFFDEFILILYLLN